MASNGIKQLPSSLSSTFALQKDIHVNVPSGHQFDASSCQKEMSRRFPGNVGAHLHGYHPQLADTPRSVNSASAVSWHEGNASEKKHSRGTLLPSEL